MQAERTPKDAGVRAGSVAWPDKQSIPAAGTTRIKHELVLRARRH